MGQQLMKVRGFLNDNGYKDNEIQWNPDTNAVSARGQYFGTYKPAADESTYDTQDGLQSNLLRMNTNSALNQYRNLGTAMQGREQFSYDPNSDPLYQSGLQAAQKSAQTASNNAYAQMRATGRGRNSWTDTVTNNIQQSAVSDVNSKLLPQLFQQAYQRWMDKQSLTQQDFQNAGAILDKTNTLAQQGLDNAYRDKVYDRGVLESDRTYGLNKSAQDAQMTGLYNPYGGQISRMNANSQAWFGASPEEQARLAAENQAIAKEIGAYQDPNGDWVMPGAQQTTTERQRQADNLYRDKTFDYTKDQDAIKNSQWDKNYALNERQTNASIANAAADNARAAGNRSMSTLMDIWKMRGTAPAGIDGVPEGTPLYDSYSGGGSKSTNVSSYVNQLNKMYTSTVDDGNGKQVVVNNPDALERAILALNLSPDQSRYLYEYYGLKIPE